MSTHAVIWIDHNHPTDGEIVARARSYFKAADRMSMS